MGIFDAILNFITGGDKNKTTNEPDFLKEIKAKVLELENTLNKQKKSSNTNTDNISADFEKLLPTFLLLLDYTLDKSKLDTPEKIDEITRELEFQLSYKVAENPINIIFGKLYSEFNDIESDMSNVKIKTFDDLAKYMHNEKEKIKVIQDLEQKLQELLAGALDYSQFKVLEQLYRTFPIARRIQNIYIQSILQTDIFTNDYLIIKPDRRKFEDEYPYLVSANIDYDLLSDEVISIFKRLRKHVNEKYLLKNRILDYATKYGTCFVEILHKEEFLRTRDLSTNIFSKLSQIVKEEIIAENTDKLHLLTHSSKTQQNPPRVLKEKLQDIILDSILTELIDVDTISFDSDDNNDILLIERDQNEREDKNNNNNNNIFEVLKSFDERYLDKVKIIVHKPYNVIPLHDDNTIYGYIVIDKKLLADKSVKDEILEKLARVFNETDKQILKYSEAGKNALDKLTEQILQNINKQLKKILQKKIEEDGNSNQSKDKIKQLFRAVEELFNNNEFSNNELKTLKYNIYNYLLDLFTNKALSKLSIRIVPPENMVRFYLKESEFPYGESVLSNITLHSILYLISVYSNILNRLTRSTLYRIWRINATVLKSKNSINEETLSIYPVNSEVNSLI
jgi:hypothetical protein